MKKPLLLGHRGARASRQVPENTLASFELCLKHGCDGFEFDVRRSADGFAVVCHDPTCKGSEIAQTSAARLGLPTLEEVMRVFGARAFLDIELKVEGLEEQAVELLHRHPMNRGCFVSSFLPRVLHEVRRLDASIPLGFLYDRELREGPLKFDAEWIVPRLDLVDEGLVGGAHAAAKKVAVWTVNREEDIRRVVDWGVDVVITDETGKIVGLQK